MQKTKKTGRREKITTNIPEAYTLGDIPFLDSDIDLSLHPFIPRTETEFWVSEVLGQIQKEKGERESMKILDAFTGSGAIGIAALKKIPDACAEFIEKNPKLKKQIEINLAKNGIQKSQAKILLGDAVNILEQKAKKAQKKASQKYDFIFANPPYIDPAKKHTVQKSVLDHEPHEALFAKDRGLFYAKKLIALAPAVLAPGGKMYIEFGAGQKREIEKFFKIHRNQNFPPTSSGGSSPKGWEGNFLKDQYGKWRVLEIAAAKSL